MSEQIKRIIKDKSDKEHIYLITPFLGRDGIKMLGKITAIFSDILPDSIDLNDFNTNDAGIVIETALKLTKKSLTLLNDEQFNFIYTELFRFTVRDEELLSNEAKFDFAYQANYGELTKAIIAIIDVNYGDNIIKDFFDGLKKTANNKLGLNLQKVQKFIKS